MMSQNEMTFEQSKLGRCKLFFAILSMLFVGLVCIAVVVLSAKAAAKTDSTDNENMIVETMSNEPAVADLMKEYNSIIPDSSRIGYDHDAIVKSIESKEAHEKAPVAVSFDEDEVDSAKIEEEIIEPVIKEVVKVEEVVPVAAPVKEEKKEAVEASNEKEETVEETTYVEYTWSGSVLTPSMGVNYGPSGKETYYNLWMGGVVSIMRNMGFDEEHYPYWVRSDGCKMLGDYIMVAANLDLRPRGSLVECSLGTAIVCDTGGFAYNDMYQLDIAVDW